MIPEKIHVEIMHVTKNSFTDQVLKINIKANLSKSEKKQPAKSNQQEKTVLIDHVIFTA